MRKPGVLSSLLMVCGPFQSSLIGHLVIQNNKMYWLVLTWYKLSDHLLRSFGRPAVLTNLSHLERALQGKLQQMHRTEHCQALQILGLK
ncbi:unnamed protein product [Protopolystoma xenopodis]|uniref:Uncharacterized protein n=1 Tax=Protopolystoma xenopodis TaxID=117903 RepID=A0A448XCA7_9PLAT|nr:unnamed protein product [Protopolystoma xenopodis]